MSDYLVVKKNNITLSHLATSNSNVPGADKYIQIKGVNGYFPVASINTTNTNNPFIKIDNKNYRLMSTTTTLEPSTNTTTTSNTVSLTYAYTHSCSIYSHTYTKNTTGGRTTRTTSRTAYGNGTMRFGIGANSSFLNNASLLNQMTMQVSLSSGRGLIADSIYNVTAWDNASTWPKIGTTLYNNTNRKNYSTSLTSLTRFHLLKPTVTLITDTQMKTLSNSDIYMLITSSSFNHSSYVMLGSVTYTQNSMSHDEKTFTLFCSGSLIEQKTIYI